MKKIFLALPLLALFSCEKILVDYEIPNPGDKLTIEALLLAGDTISALVGESVYSLSNDYPYAGNDYFVTLYENNQLVDTLEARFLRTEEFYQNNSFVERDIYRYYSDRVAETSKTYRLQAAKQNFTTISGSTNILSPVQASFVSYDSLTAKYSITFTDATGSDDYYRVRVLIKEGPNEYYTASMFYTDPTVESFGYVDPIEPDQEVVTNEAFVRDEFFKNGTKKFSFGVYFSETNADVYFEVARVNQNFYKFKSTLALYYNTDEFFGEPVQIFSNVENGYGIVAGGSATLLDLP
jgi:hypothetical protein